MNIEVIRVALAAYVTVLAKSADDTDRAEDRVTYEQHLANSARIFLALESSNPKETMLQLVRDEQRFYGVGFLSGEVGSAAETAFTEYASIVEDAM